MRICEIYDRVEAMYEEHGEELPDHIMPLIRKYVDRYTGSDAEIRTQRLSYGSQVETLMESFNLTCSETLNLVTRIHDACEEALRKQNHPMARSQYPEILHAETILQKY